MVQTKNKRLEYETMTCESCGIEFSCGAKAGKCWCFEVEVKEADLAQIEKDFQGCLCKDCLESYGKKEK